MSKLTAMTSTRGIVAASCLGLLLAGPSSSVGAQQREVAAKSGDLLVYYCQNLSLVTVRVLPKGVEVATANRRVMLTETPQPSVARFSDGSVTLSELGELVRLEEPGSVSWCRIDLVEVPWQDARLRGIDFRAAGDPMWSLEVDDGVAAEFATGQGASRVVTKFPGVPLGGKETRLTMTAASGAHTIAVVAERRICHYAGSTMTLSVTVTLDGRTYAGCGRLLAAESPVPK
jgi:hypothetical protein